MPQSYQQGCVNVISLDERLTNDEAATLQPLLVGATKHRLPQLILDLRRVRVVDSAGLELLCEVHASCLARGGMLRIASAGTLVRDVLRVTGLDEELGLCDDVVSAAGAFAQ